MKPSVHLQHVGTGRRWVGRCTGEPQPGNFIRFGCGDFWIESSPFSVVLLDPSSLILLDPSAECPRHAILRVIDTRLYLLYFQRDGTQAPGWTGWTKVQTSDLPEVGLRILWVGEGLSPFTPAQLAWGGGTVVNMARAILDDACFSDLPVLA